MTTPLIIAHRGDSRNAPENTLSAFRMAIQTGVDGIEFDVRLTRDQVPIVIHDDTLERTGQRTDSISEITSKQLKEIDVGSWFNLSNPDRAKPEFADERLSTLVEVLHAFRNFNGLFYIELKSDSSGSELAVAVCEVIKGSPLLRRIIVKSFDLELIREVRKNLPDVQTAALFEPTLNTMTQSREHLIDLAKDAGAHQLSIHYLLMSEAMMLAAGRAAMPVTVWTVDDPEWSRRHTRFDIKALITNDPKLFLVDRN